MKEFYRSTPPYDQPKPPESAYALGEDHLASASATDTPELVDRIAESHQMIHEETGSEVEPKGEQTSSSWRRTEGPTLETLKQHLPEIRENIEKAIERLEDSENWEIAERAAVIRGGLTDINILPVTYSRAVVWIDRKKYPHSYEETIRLHYLKQLSPQRKSIFRRSRK